MDEEGAAALSECMVFWAPRVAGGSREGGGVGDSEFRRGEDWDGLRGRVVCSIRAGISRVLLSSVLL